MFRGGFTLLLFEFGRATEKKIKKKKKEGKVKLSFAMDDEEEEGGDSRASSSGSRATSVLKEDTPDGQSHLSFIQLFPSRSKYLT